MSDLHLPRDLVDFLNAGKKLEYDPASVEPGIVGLKSLSDLEVGVVWVNAGESPLGEDDPHADDEGYCANSAIPTATE